MHLLSMVRQVAGKDLSFNNVLDLNSGRLLVEEFSVPACAIIKHNNPCGAAIGGTAGEAYERAFACDPQSAYGGIVCLNRPVDGPLAELIAGRFCEVLFAPHFTEDALAVLAAKPNMRILEDNERRRFDIAERDLKRVMGGLLVQDRDIDLEDRTQMEVVTERKPSEAEWGEMLFGWKVCKHVRSNAIVLVSDLATVGIGAGQMSRVDSVRLAIEKAGDAGIVTGRVRARVGRVLPVRRRPAVRDRGRRDVDHPARRVQARHGGRRGRRRGRDQHGLHAPPALQALTRFALEAPEPRQHRHERDRPGDADRAAGGDRERDAGERRDRPAARRAERRADRVGELLDPRQAAAHPVGDRLVPQRLAEDLEEASAAPAAASATSASGSASARPKTRIAGP